MWRNKPKTEPTSSSRQTITPSEPCLASWSTMTTSNDSSSTSSSVLQQQQQQQLQEPTQQKQQLQGQEPTFCQLRAQEVDTASAFLSIEGPCRQVGNVYLACVATAGLGMCRSLRADSEACAKDTRLEAREQLTMIGQRNCEGSDDPQLCAAQMALRHYLPIQHQQPHQPSAP